MPDSEKVMAAEVLAERAWVLVGPSGRHRIDPANVAFDPAFTAERGERQADHNRAAIDRQLSDRLRPTGLSESEERE